MNFRADSYRAEVNETRVIVRVFAFGSIDTPFLVEVVPDVAEDIPEGTIQALICIIDWTITVKL